MGPSGWIHTIGEPEKRLELPLAVSAPDLTPPVDIEESEKEYMIKAELPGMKKDEVKVKVEGGTLSISGERKEEKDKKYHRVGRSYGAFSRSFTLPEGALAEKISAEFKDGVLMVHLPKEEKAKAKTIEVKVS